MPRTNSVQDELLRVSGSTDNPKQNVTANANTTPVYVGPDRRVAYRLMVTGTVTGTSPTLDAAVQICSDASGTGAQTVASFPQQTASMATATGALANPPTVVAVTTTAKPYVRIAFTVGGTSPVFNGVQVLHEPTPSPVI